MPDRIEMQVKYLDMIVDIAATGCSVELFGDRNTNMDRWWWGNNYLMEGEIEHRMPYRNCLCHPSLMFRAEVLKEYMYDLVEEMGWRGELKCFNNGAVKQSFESIQIEFKNGKKKYWGTYAHIVEGIVRAIWLAKNKSLSIYIY